MSTRRSPVTRRNTPSYHDPKCSKEPSDLVKQISEGSLYPAAFIAALEPMGSATIEGTVPAYM